MQNVSPLVESSLYSCWYIWSWWQHQHQQMNIHNAERNSEAEICLEIELDWCIGKKLIINHPTRTKNPSTWQRNDRVSTHRVLTARRVHLKIINITSLGGTTRLYKCIPKYTLWLVRSSPLAGPDVNKNCIDDCKRTRFEKLIVEH